MPTINILAECGIIEVVTIGDLTGANMKTFQDMAAALDWLNGQRTPV